MWSATSGVSLNHLWHDRTCVDFVAVGGDSGAWVIDNLHGRVCGHVLAWSSKNRVAYIAPMQVMLEDIGETLGVSRVSLPHPRTASPIEPSLRDARRATSGKTPTMAIEKPLPPLPVLKESKETPFKALHVSRPKTGGILPDLAECMDEIQGVVGGHFDLGLDTLRDLEKLQIDDPSLEPFPDTNHLHDVRTSYTSKSGMVVGEQKMSSQLTQSCKT